MMLSAFTRSTLSAATQICALEWIVWQHWWKHRWEISLMYLIPFIFSVGGGQTVSKDSYGKGTDGSCHGFAAIYAAAAHVSFFERTY